VEIFMGVARRDNAAMRRVLEASGAHACLTIGADEVLYVGPILKV
jgi:hypothetical protein